MPRLRYAFSLLIALLIAPLAPLNAAPQQTRAAQSTATSQTRTTRTDARTSRQIATTRKAAQHITQAKMREDLTYISSDALGGRDTPSPGLDLAAEYIAARMRKLKLKPAGDAGTYFQRIDLRRYRTDEQANTATINGERLMYGEDFLTTLGAGAASGRLVFVGDGWVIKAKNINAYEGVDVRDKVMIVTTSGTRPAGVTPAELAAAKQGVDWYDPTSYAKANGARGIILLPRVPNFAQWWEGRKRAMARGFTVVKAFEDANSLTATVPTMMPSEKLLLRLFEGEGERGTAALTSIKSGAAVPAFDLTPSKVINFNVQSAQEPAKTQNVVAVLEGSDPVLKNEYVAYGAHYDHVGTGTPVDGDAIYNGADDDGSGTTALMAIAEAFAKGKRPRRSILFVWHAGEEKGLWGARYFVENPTVPLTSIVGQINIDMIGRSKAEGDTNPKNKDLSGANEIYVIGSRMMSDALGNLTAQVNDDYLKLNFNYLYDDPADPNRFFFRSDHYHYAAKGIPIVFFFDGVHEDYHRPSDTVDKIDFGKMERVTRTVFALGSEIANAAERLKVDRLLPANMTR